MKTDKTKIRLHYTTIFQLEGIYRHHLVQLPDQVKADQTLMHGVKGIVQISPKCRQGRGINHLSKYPMFDQPLNKVVLHFLSPKF